MPWPSLLTNFPVKAQRISRHCEGRNGVPSVQIHETMAPQHGLSVHAISTGKTTLHVLYTFTFIHIDLDIDAPSRHYMAVWALLLPRAVGRRDVCSSGSARFIQVSSQSLRLERKYGLRVTGFCFASTALSTQRLSRSRCDLSGRGLTAATQSRSVKLLSMQSSTPSNASTIHKMTPRHSDQHVHNSMSTPGSFEQYAPSRAPICTGVVAAPQGAQHDTQKSPPPRKSTCPSCSSSATTSRIRRVTE